VIRETALELPPPARQRVPLHPDRLPAVAAVG
jgi:hypothetical protein